MTIMYIKPYVFFIKNWRIIAKSLLKWSKMHNLSNLYSYLMGKTRFRAPKSRIFCIFDQNFIVLVTISKSLLKDCRRIRSKWSQIMEITTILMLFSNLYWRIDPKALMKWWKINDFSNLYSNLMPKNTFLSTFEKDSGGIS